MLALVQHGDLVHCKIRCVLKCVKTKIKQLMFLISLLKRMNHNVL